MSTRPYRWTESDLIKALTVAKGLGPVRHLEITREGPINIAMADGQVIPVLIPAASQKKDRDGFVYFVKAGRRGDVKIGFSNDPKRRLASMQTSISKDLVLLGAIPGTMDDEADLHAKFAHLRTRGEWFKHTKELQAFISGALK